MVAGDLGIPKNVEEARRLRDFGTLADIFFGQKGSKGGFDWAFVWMWGWLLKRG